MRNHVLCVLVAALSLAGLILTSPAQSQSLPSDSQWKLTHTQGVFASAGCIVKSPGTAGRPGPAPRPGASARSKSWNPQRDGVFTLVLINKARQSRAMPTSLIAPKLRIYQIKRTRTPKTENVLQTLQGKATSSPSGKLAKPGANLASFEYVWTEELTLPDGEYRAEVVGSSPKVEVRIKLARLAPHNPKDAREYRPIEY